MKFLVCVLVAVVAFESTGNALDKAPNLQVTAAEVAAAVKAATTAVTKYDTILNNFFLQSLENATQIREASVNVQTSIILGLANISFNYINTKKENANMTSEQLKLLDCVADEEITILDILDEAFFDNGWCNNRLAANLTSAFQEITAAILPVSTELEGYADSLSTCLLGDQVCLALFGTEVASLISKQSAGTEGTIAAGVKDAISIYKVMFGEDVPQCAEDILFPALKSGFSSIYSEVEACVKA